MRPLVFYCRWHQLTLRLAGRSETEVWGELLPNGVTEQAQATPFRFHLQTWELQLGDTTPERLQLDEKGIVLTD